MNSKKKSWVFTALLILILLQGCEKRSPEFPSQGESLTPSQAQNLLQQTTWYFSSPIAAPKRLYGFEIESSSKSQIRIKSNSGTIMIYEENIPDRGLKAYRLGGKLKPLAGINEPIFETDFPESGTKKSFRLIGFLDKRIFIIHVSFSGEYAPALADAVKVATNAFHPTTLNVKHLSPSN